MQISQSYLSCIMQGKLSVYALRIFLQIVQRSNEVLEGTLSKQYLKQQADYKSVSCRFSVEIRDILTDGSQHYEEVKNAAIELEKKIITYYDPTKKAWLSSPMIYAVVLKDGSGVIEFQAAEWVVKLILNFSQGFSHYQFSNAMMLQSSYSLRLYMLTASLSRPISYKIDFLRKLLGVENKYKQTRDFLKRCIFPVAEDLQDRKLNGFEVVLQKERNKFDSVLLKPIKREETSAQALTAKAGLSAWCDNSLKMYLIQQCDFSARELSANKNTLMMFTKIPNWQELLINIVERQRRKRAPKGYVIGAFKSATRAAIADNIIKQE